MFEVSNAVAHANTLPEMNLAFESLFTLMALPEDSVKRDIWISSPSHSWNRVRPSDPRLRKPMVPSTNR